MLLVAGGAMSTLTVSRLLLGIGTVKLSALTIGPGGLGLLAQGNQLYLLGSSVASLGIINGLISSVSAARNANNLEAERTLFGTALILQIGTTLLLTVAFVIASRPITQLVFGRDDPSTYLFPVLLAIPAAVFGSNFIEGTFFASGRYDLYTKASIWAAVAGALVFVPLVLLWGVTGAFWAIPAGGVALVAAFLIYATRCVSLGTLFNLRFSPTTALTLGRYGGAMLAVGALSMLSALAVRSGLLATLGPAPTGFYQVSLAFTAYYSALVTNPLWGRLHPTVSARGDSPASVAELEAAIRLVMIASALMVGAVLLMGSLFVQIAYSHAFLPAVQIFPYQLPGDLLYLSAFTCGVYLIAVGRLRAYVIGAMIYYLSATAIPLLLVHRFGLAGVGAGYTMSGVLIGACWMAWYARVAGKDSFVRVVLTTLWCVGFAALQAAMLIVNTAFTTRALVFTIWMVVTAILVWRSLRSSLNPL
jgi:PST family polysaccharide transporter